MYSPFLELYNYLFKSLLVFIGLAIVTYAGLWLVDYFGAENCKTRELKKKLWRNFRFTYYEIFNQLSTRELKEMAQVCNNTYKNSLPIRVKCTDDFVIDFSAKPIEKAKRRVQFDLP